MAAELKRLRRENEILRQEREILKRAATFSPRRKSMRFRLIDAAKRISRPASMQGPRRQCERIPRLEGAPGLPPTA